MIQNVLREIGGIGAYGVISICLFFSIFLGALLWAGLQPKSTLRQIETLPLDEEATPPENGKTYE